MEVNGRKANKNITNNPAGQKHQQHKKRAGKVVNAEKEMRHGILFFSNLVIFFGFRGHEQKN